VVRELAETRAELDALRRTRTYRWTHPARSLYGRLQRGRRTAAERHSADIYAEPRDVHDLSECRFYHSFDLPRHGEVVGSWDLRPGIDDYLGHVDYRGKRVLEVGPSSGYVTIELERRGASVVAVELADQADYDVLPAGYPNAPGWADHELNDLERTKNAWWLVHSEFRSRALAYYGSIRNLPEEIGQFDVTFIGAVLLHSHDPLGIVLSCAARTRETMVITEIVDPSGPDHGDEPVAVFYPSVENRVVRRWWTFSPELFVQLLSTLGFGRTSVTYHEQHFVGVMRRHPMFTVVASR